MPEAVQRVIGVLKRLRVFLIAGAIVLLIVLGLYAYSGIWPPLVVVESNSMQHSATTSYIGVIDTGDMVILKKISSVSEIKTYVESISASYQTYGEYGDVVIYRPNVSYASTPIIHRAFLRIEKNATGGGYDIPSLNNTNLPADFWTVSSGPKVWYNLKTVITFHGVGYDGAEVRLDLTKMHHDGLITLGDHNNGGVDQMTSTSAYEPVLYDRIDGVARGELPWFGLLKLWITGPSPEGKVPENSKTDLFICLALIIGVPIAVDVGGVILERKGIDAKAWLRSKLHVRRRSEDGDGGSESETSAPPPEEPPTKSEPKKQPQKGKGSTGKSKSHTEGHRHGKKRRR